MKLPFDIQTIVDEIVAATGIPYDEIRSKNNNRKVVVAKRALCYHLRVRLKLSLWEICEIVGLSNHTHVLYHLERAEEILFTNKNDEAKLLRLANK